MDTAPGVRTCLCWCAWHWLNRFPDVFASCSRSHKCYFGVMHSYHPYSSTTRWSPGDRSVCVCVCVCFCGAPRGEAGQSLPVAALGQGMAIQDTCLATGPNVILAPFVFILPLHTFPSPVMYSDPRFNPSVPKSPFFVSFAYLFLQFVLWNCACLSWSFPVYVTRTFSLYLGILARLYFFISCAVGGVKVGGGGSPTGRQSTLILIRRRTEQSGGWELWAVNGTGQLSESTTTLLLHVCLQA